MQYNQGTRLDPSQVEYRSGGRGGGGGGRVAVGGVSGIIVLVLALLFGINPAELMGGGSSGSVSEPGTDMTQCQTGADVEKDRNCRFVVYTNTANQYWSSLFNTGYQPGTTVLFEGQTVTGCGTATTDVGPFYCPNDQKIYLDPSFTRDMLQGQLGGLGGDAAEAYVVGHEFGHHIQNLTGRLAQVQQAGQQTGPNSPQVKLELQADCYAGAYLANVTSQPNAPMVLNQDDLNRMVDAAKVVGDDYIQQHTQGGINPDAWTHGSSAERKHWLAQGFNNGVNVCEQVFNSAG